MTSTMPPPLLEVQQLSRHYRLPRRQLWSAPACVAALDDISLQVQAGRSLGVVGESGSGKSTLARLIMALDRPTSGHIRLLGQDLSALSASELRAHRRHFQMVFQDPYGSLDPRQTVARTVAEPLEVLGATAAERRTRVAEVLAQVGLRPSDLDRYPHEFSGGQRQRIAIARALITRPRLIVADEPVSALDVSVQAQVLNLMQQLQQDHGVTFVLISHDLAVVQQLCQEVVVLHQGHMVERGSPEQLFTAPQHPYTRQLVQAVPHIAPGLARARRQARQAAATTAAQR
ncbi:ATP-binding cassette domain-containing protein [Comamonas sp. GB3 AK4-5]|uniref:ATP-binding cassette domain-containing protein n=1 Tax=Comamonas sp. GB3 AK4-5 TaxID=3231487 RepID=UPI00351E2724